MLVIGGDFFKRIFCKFEPESGKFMKAIWGASNRNSGRGQPTDPNPASYLPSRERYVHIQRNQPAHPPRLANAASIGLLVLSVLTCPPLPASKRRVLATKRTQDLQPVAAVPAPSAVSSEKWVRTDFVGESRLFWVDRNVFKKINKAYTQNVARLVTSPLRAIPYHGGSILITMPPSRSPPAPSGNNGGRRACRTTRWHDGLSDASASMSS